MVRFEPDRGESVAGVPCVAPDLIDADRHVHLTNRIAGVHAAGVPNVNGGLSYACADSLHGGCELEAVSNIAGLPIPEFNLTLTLVVSFLSGSQSGS